MGYPRAFPMVGQATRVSLLAVASEVRYQPKTPSVRRTDEQETGRSTRSVRPKIEVPSSWNFGMYQTTLALVLFLFPLAYSPGPGNMFFAANGARFGFRATIPANAGYHIATWVVTAAIGFGFLVVIERFPQLFKILQIAGSLYVLWIAWKMLKAGTLQGSEDAKPATFVDGAVLLLLNPKAYVIIALMFTQFLGPTGTSSFALVILITTVFTLNNLIAFSIWTLIGDVIASFFRSSESSRRLNFLFGAVLAAVAIWMLFA